MTKRALKGLVTTAASISLWPAVVYGVTGVTFEFRDAPGDTFGGLHETQVHQGGSFSLDAWIHASEPVAVVSFKPSFLEYPDVKPATFIINAVPDRQGSGFPNSNTIDSLVPGEDLVPENESDLGGYIDPPDWLEGDQFVVRLSLFVDPSMPVGTYTIGRSSFVFAWGKPEEGGDFEFADFEPYYVRVLAVPEPGEYALAAGFGLLGLSAFRRYRRHQLTK